MQDQEEINETLNDLSKDYGETYSKDTSEKKGGWIDEVNKKIAENPTLSKVIQHGNRSGTVVTMVVSNNPLVEKYEKYRDDYDIKEDDYGPIQLKRILEGRRKRKFLKQLIGNDYLDYMGILGYETEDRFVSFLLYFIRIKHLIRIHYFIRVCYTYGEEYYCEHRKINHEEYMNRLDSVSEVIKPLLLDLIELPKFSLQIKYPMYDLSRQYHKHLMYLVNGETTESLKKKDDNFNDYFHTQSPHYEKAFYIEANEFNYKYIVENGYKIIHRPSFAMKARRFCTYNLLTVYVTNENKFEFVDAGPIIYFGETLSTKDFIRVMRGDIIINYFPVATDELHFERRSEGSKTIYKYEFYRCLYKLKDGKWVEPEWWDIEPDFDDYLYYIETLTDEDAYKFITEDINKAKKEEKDRIIELHKKFMFY